MRNADDAELGAGAHAEFEQLVAVLSDAPVAPFEHTKAAFGDYVPLGNCGVELARQIEACITAGQPASFLRLGDGEGNALALDEFPLLAAYCGREISLMHFGDPDVLRRSTIAADLHDAIAHADVVGFPDRRVLRWALTRGRHIDPRALSGLASVYAYLTRFSDELGLASKTGTSSAFARELLPHYRGLVENRDIGIVTCHDSLVDLLQRGLGARTVEGYPVPHQAKLAVTGSDTGHVPQRYRALLDELRRDVRPGRLYLVAAGIPAKSYCEAIRSAGGIAVDIGSTADLWVGVRSRWGMREEMLATWRLG